MKIATVGPETTGKLEALSERNKSGDSFSFAEEIKKNLQTVDNLQHEADRTMRDRSVKGATKIHEAMIQLQEADISMKLLLKVRNKAYDAYQEIMKTQI
jgi:flagellar hook-basal body complex protein FliE